MFKIFKKTAFFSCLILIISCRKFIQVPPPVDSITTSEAFADSASANAAIAGLYINMWNNGSASIADAGLDLYAGTSSDEMTGTSTVSFTQELNSDNITVTNSYVASLWSTGYKYIYDANSCIDGASASTSLSSSMQNEVIGEAKFVRALMHFDLMNLFGAVPLVLTTDFTKSSVIPRTSTDSIYAQITEDLASADSMLSSAPTSNNSIINKYTVESFRAREALYLKKWADAEKYATEVINSGQYSILHNLDSVFLTGSNEAIWQLPTAYAGYETTIGQYIVPYSSGVLPEYVAMPQLLAAFEPGDLRMQHWLQSTEVGTTEYYYPFKYKLSYDNSLSPKEAYVIFRLAEQYLIRAEARAEQGELDGATQDINVIRTRAGLAATKATTQKDILNAVMHERQVELCFEGGHRWFDLKRTGAVDTTLGAPNNVKPQWKSSAALYPIPYIEMQQNPFLTQNPGY